MQEMKRYRWVLFFGVLTLGMLCFIFGHSLQTRAESIQQSEGWFLLLRPFLDPAGRFDDDTIHKIVRKIAHFAEFGALGLSVGGLTVSLGRLKKRRYIALPMLMVLSAAVCDEYIQCFTGRAGMVTDVVLDYAGALTGLLVTAAAVWWQRRYIYKNGR